MALGTVTPVKGADHVSGNKRVRVRDVQLTTGANYTTGGETFTLAQLGVKTRVDTIHVSGSARNTAGTSALGIGFNYVSPQVVKIQAYSAGTESASNTDLSTFTVRIVVTGA